MMENKTQILLINFFFTIILACLSLPIILESRIYFAKNLTQNLFESDFINYKILSLENKKTPTYYNNQDYLLHQNKVVKKIEIVKDLYELEDEAKKSSLPQKIIEDIYGDPLLKGFYVQLGIFKSKEEASKIITELLSKSVITENDNVYIDAKSIQDKQFYIPQIGVFEDKNNAINFCSHLQKMNVNCLIVD